MTDAGDPCDEDDESPSTRRLKFCRPAMSDAAELARLADNPKVAANISMMPHPYRRSDAEAWIARCGALSAGEAAFLLRDRTGRLVGGAGAARQEDSAEPEIGCWIGEPFWGSGLGTEAAQGLIDHLFRVHRPVAVWAACRVTNAASRRVIEKCGFQWAGTGLKQSRALGGMMAVERYRLERRSWVAIKAWAGAGLPGHAGGVRP
ncbi:GNAT family N-acetyltransferase [Pseudoxanthobacter sp.]|uniref:GNAT family N-acetyltransferase n=1 Tax=Pseudoxanthobacter sp. TaxID=1925742 RepID=UPI002FE383B6